MAIDKGPNQPNVFVDPKSSESAPPHHSLGTRDDRAQRALLEAHHGFWTKDAHNPLSTVYGRPMVDPSRFFVYAWDARPFPDFPVRKDVWADAGNWMTGHWLNGRAGRVPLSALIERIARDAGVRAVDASACDRLVTGLTLDRPVSGRAALEPILDLFQLDAFTREDVLVVRPRTGAAEARLSEEDLIAGEADSLLTLEHAQDEELPGAIGVTFADELSGFELKSLEARDGSAPQGRKHRLATALVLEQGEALERARSLLAEARAMRLRGGFGLPASRPAFEPGDVLEVGSHTLRIIEIEDAGLELSLSAVRTDPGLFAGGGNMLLADPPPLPVVHGGVLFEALDLPILPAGKDEAQLRLAAFAEPWPGRIAVHRGSGADAPRIAELAEQSLFGRLTAALPSGVCGRWDRASAVEVRLSAGGLASRPPEDILAGAHLCAVRTAAGWEILQFRDASLQPGGTWRLTHLLRGRFGTEFAAASGAEAGARFVLLGRSETFPLDADLWGSTEIWQAGPADALPGAYPFRETTVSFEGAGARPYSPVHLTVSAEEDSITVRWIRRTRIGGDRLAGGDVPLGETSEVYEILLRDGNGDVIAKDFSTRPEYHHHGAWPASVEVRQVSAAYGPGPPAVLTL